MMVWKVSEIHLLLLRFVLVTIIYIPITAASAEDSSLNGTYSKIMLLSSTQAINASSFKTSEKVHYSRYSLPLSTSELKVGEATSLSGWIRGGYLKVKAGDSLTSEDGGKIALRWDAYSVSTGGIIKYAPSEHLVLNAGLGFGFIRMTDMTKFHEVSIAEKEILKRDGLFSWKTESLLLSPSLGGKYRYPIDNGDEITLSSEVSWNMQYSLSRLPHDERNIVGAGIWGGGTD
ncbi:hypothetical protein [Rahnella sp. PAMC 25559]|uniref:hypothetical protein n=1 Tax=Rahnella sp. PAMC 25559 TaxID=3423225 RepID=UPI003D67B006